MKKIASILISILLCLTVFSAGFDTYAAADMSISPSAISILVGNTKTIKIKVNNKSYSAANCVFKSGNTAVAKVSNKGVVSGRKKGTTTITVSLKSDKNVKKTCRVTVKPNVKYTVSPAKKPLNGKYTNYLTYNSTTRHYFMLRSYMDALEKKGGGMLILKKGTYKISNVIYVPSYISVVMEDGVVLKKTSKTATSKMKPSGTLFMFCSPAKSEKKNAYKGYGGVNNVDFIGKGKVRIDMADSPKGKTAAAFVLCHCKNINFENIGFENLKERGHFAEVDASQNVSFKNCSFKNAQKYSIDKYEECINLDIPDKKTGGINHPWITYDLTPNKNITVSGCTFDRVHSGVGTHAYTDKKFHTNITVTGCTFKNCLKSGINMWQWKDFKITNNVFNGVGMTAKSSPYTKIANKSKLIEVTTAITGFGLQGKCTVSGNKFYNCFNTMRFNKSSPQNGYKGCYTSFSYKDYDSFAAKNLCDYSTCNYVVNDWGIRSYQVRAYNVPSMGYSSYYADITEM